MKTTLRIYLIAIVIVLVACNESKSTKELELENENLKLKLEIEQSQNGQSIKLEPIVKKSNDKTRPRKVEMQNLKSFILPAYDFVESNGKDNIVYGDFNNDGIQDAAALLTSHPNLKAAKNINLAIFHGKSNGEYVEVTSTDNLNPGFIKENTTSRISLKNNVITIKHNELESDFAVKFRYSNEQMDYHLIGSDINFYASEGYEYGTVSKNFLTGKIVVTNGNKTENFKVPVKFHRMDTIDINTLYNLIAWDTSM